jgi:metal-responsive CopG/Arc/MetJ family transcriptional regulator
MITETDEAASAIDALIAAKGGAMSRSEALRVILQEGIRALDPTRIQLRT